MKDKLGQELSVGDVVAYRQHVYLEIGRVTKLTDKRIFCKIIHPTYSHSSQQLDGTVIKLNPDDALLSAWTLRGCP